MKLKDYKYATVFSSMMLLGLPVAYGEESLANMAIETLELEGEERPAAHQTNKSVNPHSQSPARETGLRDIALQPEDTTDILTDVMNDTDGVAISQEKAVKPQTANTIKEKLTTEETNLVESILNEETSPETTSTNSPNIQASTRRKRTGYGRGYESRMTPAGNDKPSISARESSIDRPGKVDRPERIERPQRIERISRPERPERPGK